MTANMTLIVWAVSNVVRMKKDLWITFTEQLIPAFGEALINMSSRIKAFPRALGLEYLLGVAWDHQCLSDFLGLQSFDA